MREEPLDRALSVAALKDKTSSDNQSNFLQWNSTHGLTEGFPSLGGREAHVREHADLLRRRFRRSASARTRELDGSVDVCNNQASVKTQSK